MGRPRKDRVLRKPVQTIHCSNSVSLTSRKLFNIFLWNSFKTSKNLEPEEYEIDMDLVLKYTNISYKNVSYLNFLINEVKELCKTTVEWNIRKDGNERWGISVLLGSMETTSNNKVRYSFPIHLRRLIVNNGIFGIVKLGISKNFKSKYSLALYENCMRYINTGSTGYINVDDVRDLLGANSKMYSEYKNLYRCVIKPALNEINDKSDIILNMETKKKNRYIDQIKFNIQKKPGIEYSGDIEELKQKELDISSQSPNDEYFQQQIEKARKGKEMLKNQ